VYNPVLVQVRQPIQQLPHQALHHIGVDGAWKHSKQQDQRAYEVWMAGLFTSCHIRLFTT
jgi:hypothetical protein